LTPFARHGMLFWSLVISHWSLVFHLATSYFWPQTSDFCPSVVFSFNLLLPICQRTFLSLKLKVQSLKLFKGFLLFAFCFPLKCGE